MSEVQESANETSQPKKETADAGKEEENPQDKETEPQEKDGDQEDEQLGLLDQPLIIEGKRKRKSVESFQSPSTSSKKRRPTFEEGSGQRLGDIASIYVILEKRKSEDLRQLHRFLFGRVGQKNETKKNIKAFAGFQFTEDSKEYEKHVAQLQKMQKQGLSSNFCSILGLHVSGSKEELVKRIMSFLMKPEGKEKANDAPKTRRKSRSSKGQAEDSEDKAGEDQEMEENTEEKEDNQKENEPDEQQMKDEKENSDQSFEEEKEEEQLSKVGNADDNAMEVASKTQQEANDQMEVKKTVEPGTEAEPVKVED